MEYGLTTAICVSSISLYGMFVKTKTKKKVKFHCHSVPSFSKYKIIQQSKIINTYESMEMQLSELPYRIHKRFSDLLPLYAHRVIVLVEKLFYLLKIF